MPIAAGETITVDDSVLGHTVSVGQYGAYNSISNFSSDVPAIFIRSGINLMLALFMEGSQQEQIYAVTTDWASADQINAAVIIGDYLYLLLSNGVADPDQFRVYRYAKNDLASGGTLMTFSGATVLLDANLGTDLRMASDGTSIYFNFQAGNSANDYSVAKYSISGTTLTYVSTTSLGSTSGTVPWFLVQGDGDYLALKADGTVRRFNSSGTLQTTSIAHTVSALGGVAYISDFLFYLHDTTLKVMIRLPIA